MTHPSTVAPLLRVEHLRTWFHTRSGVVRAVDDVTFDVLPGETVGVVGESGCGKSVTALSLLRLIDPPGRIEAGSRIEFEGKDLLTASDEEIRRVRGNRIAMVFQEPMTALNPVFTVGDQIAEVARVHDRAPSRSGSGRSRCFAGWNIDLASGRRSIPTSFPAGCASACSSPWHVMRGLLSPTSPRPRAT
jgi:ABC-type dipeptide/oligopeptide/nickel transport system ATPase component